MKDIKKGLAKLLSITMLAVAMAPTFQAVQAGQALLSANFETGTEGFSARGSETVSRTNTVAYEGQYSLAVSDRSQAWNGAAVQLGAGWTSGETYSFSCAVYQSSGEPVEMKLSLQYDDASGTTQYVQIAGETVPSGTWVLLEEPAYTIPAQASGRYLYIETSKSLCDFYVDAVYGALPVQYQKGDVNCDEQIDRSDLELLAAYLRGETAELSAETADLNGDGLITAADMTLLKKRFIYPERYTTTTTTTTTAATTAKVLAPGQWDNTADVSWINGRKTVALSFDDGPVSGSTSAQRIQDALTKQGFHATFFYWGNRITAANESEILEAEKRGFEVANHTWTHTDLSSASAATILSEYTQCKDKLNSILGVDREYLVRLPYLGYSSTVASTMPVPCPNCGVDSGDWNGNNAETIIRIIEDKANDGSLNGQVVLMHETYDATATAMEVLCPWLDEHGYAVVTVSEMFKYNNKEMYAGQRYNSCW